jgi:hypothetical protein
MKVLGRVLGSTAFALLFVVGAQADTIYMKNGSVLRGTVAGYSNGQFTVLLGPGSQSRAMLVGSEIDRIEFDGSTGNASTYSQPAPSTSSPTYEPSSPSSYPDTSTSSNADSYSPGGDPGGGYDPSTAQPAGGSVNEADVSVQGKVDWTPSQVRVRRGDRIRVTASGSVQLDKTGRRTSSPDGVNLPDRDKLMTSRPTGALIAVVGDDNDDFIYIGKQAEFIAARDGMLFLSVNEGELSDNSGAFRARVEVSGTGGAMPAAAKAVKPKKPAASERPPAQRRNDPVASNDPGPVASQPARSYDPDPDPAGATSEPASSMPSTPSASVPSASPSNTAVRETDVVVQAKNDWTSTQIQVQRGARVRLSAGGIVQLDKTGQKTTSPAGIELQDRGKLLPDRPTGALIAVIGDDNDDFIFIGQSGEFVAARDGLLFLSINEGELSDNSGAFNVKVTIEQPRTVAKQ